MDTENSFLENFKNFVLDIHGTKKQKVIFIELYLYFMEQNPWLLKKFVKMDLQL